MLIHSLPSLLAEDGALPIPPHCKAPLGLARNAKLFAVSNERQSSAFQELVISPYPFSVWNDIWRMEIEMIDRPGQYEAIVKFFDRYRIRILNQESRDAFQDGLHRKFLVLDCTGYESDIDGSNATRVESRTDRMQGLYIAFVAEFIEDLRIIERSTPRVDIARNFIHLALWQKQHARLDGRSRRDAEAEGIPCVQMKVGKSGIEIQKIPGFGNVKYDTHYVAMTTNTRSRILYCTVIERDDPRAIHLVIYFPYFQNRPLLANILQAISGVGLNIIRSQLRPGVVGALDSLPAGFQMPSWFDDASEGYTLNIFAVTMETLSREEALQRIKRKIREMTSGADIHLFVLVPMSPPNPVVLKPVGD